MIDWSDLVAAVRERSGQRPLEAVTAALGVADELGRVGDQLVTHFVLEAREAGLSWTQVGTLLGVTRQAARQKFNHGRVQAAAVGDDGIRDKPAPFSGMRVGDGDLEVQVEIGGTWYTLVELDGVTGERLQAVAKKHFGARRLRAQPGLPLWLKRLSEDLDDVYAVLEKRQGETADVTLRDAAGREFIRTVEVTIAKRKAAWRHNNAA